MAHQPSARTRESRDAAEVLTGDAGLRGRPRPHAARPRTMITATPCCDRDRARAAPRIRHRAGSPGHDAASAAAGRARLVRRTRSPHLRAPPRYASSPASGTQRGRRSIKASRSTFPRRTPIPAKTCSSSRRTAGRWCCGFCSSDVWSSVRAWPTPGEFTLRAFLSGKLDLAQAESVIDLIDATSAQAARCGNALAAGRVLSRVQELVARITELRTLVEATLDFPEEDIDFLDPRDALAARGRRERHVDAVLESASRGESCATGCMSCSRGGRTLASRACSTGWRARSSPSSRIFPARRATRSAKSIDLGGVPLHVIDTAGLRDVERSAGARGNRAHVGGARPRRRRGTGLRCERRRNRSGPQRSRRDCP